jgi:hypothetical protein
MHAMMMMMGTPHLRCLVLKILLDVRVVLLGSSELAGLKISTELLESLCDRIPALG